MPPINFLIYLKLFVATLFCRDAWKACNGGRWQMKITFKYRDDNVKDRFNKFIHIRFHRRKKEMLNLWLIMNQCRKIKDAISNTTWDFKMCVKIKIHHEGMNINVN